jgi:hypothetical protein
MLNVNFEAMEKKIEDLLRSTDLKESEIEWLKQELLNLHSVSKPLPNDFGKPPKTHAEWDAMCNRIANENK